MCTFEDRGKKYAEVNQRIKAFRMVYPQGFITTEMVSNEGGVCIFRATVGYVENLDRVILGTGTAYEKEGSTFINETSYIENAETSSVGRALGMEGFGIDVSVASAEEVLNAMENQKKPDNIDKKKAEVKKNKASAEQKKAAELKSKRDLISKYIANDEEKKEAYLNYIKAMFTTTPGTSYTNNWVNRVQTVEGTFVKNANATWDVIGDSGIPRNWGIETATA